MGERETRRVKEMFTKCSKCGGNFLGSHCVVCYKLSCKVCDGDLRDPEHKASCRATPLKRKMIVDKDGNPYLERTTLKIYPDGGKTYLHIIHKSDDDRDYHDHPFNFNSRIIYGSYINHTKNGAVTYSEGMVNVMRADDAHRLEILSGPVVTIVNRGPKIREWGFVTQDGWVHHAEYLDKKFGVGKWVSGDSDD